MFYEIKQLFLQGQVAIATEKHDPTFLVFYWQLELEIESQKKKKKKKKIPKVFQSSFVADLQALVKVQSCHTWFCLKDIIQRIPNSSNKDITFPQPKKQTSLKAWAICEWTEWPQFQFSMSQLSEILQSKSFLDLAFIQSKASMAFWSQNFQNGSSEKRKEKRLKV